MYTGEILNNEMECQKNILIKEELCDCIRKENKKKINRDSKKREKEIQKLYLVNLIFFFSSSSTYSLLFSASIVNGL